MERERPWDDMERERDPATPSPAILPKVPLNIAALATI